MIIVKGPVSFFRGIDSEDSAITEKCFQMNFNQATLEMGKVRELGNSS